MDWVLKSPSFKYLNDLNSSIEPVSKNEIIFKKALDWALSTIEIQAEVLSEIEQSYSNIPSLPNPPKLKVIQGGKIEH